MIRFKTAGLRVPRHRRLKLGGAQLVVGDELFCLGYLDADPSLLAHEVVARARLWLGLQAQVARAVGRPVGVDGVPAVRAPTELEVEERVPGHEARVSRPVWVCN
jgi:hypothetical protein